MKTKTPAVPYVIWMALFVVVPLVLIVVYAFTNYDGRFTLENFANMDVFLQVCGNSLYLAALATVVCLIIAYPFAYFLAQTGPATRKVAMLFIMLPMWMNFLLRTYAWMSILENHGFLNQLLALVGLGPLHIINTDAAVILGMVYNFLPFMILPIYNQLIRIDNNLINASNDLGANKVQTFLRVVFPLSFPGVMSGITMTFMPAVTTFVISKLLGGGQNALIGDLIEQQFKTAGDWGFGSAISVIVMILMLLAMSFVSRYERQSYESGGVLN